MILPTPPIKQRQNGLYTVLHGLATQVWMGVSAHISLKSQICLIPISTTKY